MVFSPSLVQCFLGFTVENLTEVCYQFRCFNNTNQVSNHTSKYEVCSHNVDAVEVAVSTTDSFNSTKAYTFTFIRLRYLQ